MKRVLDGESRLTGRPRGPEDYDLAIAARERKATSETTSCRTAADIAFSPAGRPEIIPHASTSFSQLGGGKRRVKMAPPRGVSASEIVHHALS